MEYAMIRQAASSDVEPMCRIYNHYVAESTITFEEQAVSPSEMSQRIADVTASSLPWLVAEHDGAIVGFAYASKWKARSAYRFSTETTVYLASGNRGQGIGTRLYAELLSRLKGRELHSAIGGVALPNDASVRLHEKLGYRKVAHFVEVGFKFDRWIDVAYWQLKL
jgi:phosphinothricin acetyltransferase